MKIVTKSMLARSASVCLVVVTIALGMSLLIVGRTAESVLRKTFERSLIGTDLIVGARGSPINLLLSSVFDWGGALDLVPWEVVERINQRSDVAWSLPLSFGDKHHNFRVIAADQGLFDKYTYGESHNIRFEHGFYDSSLHTIAIGSEVARTLNYRIGRKIHLSHGDEIAHHHEQPFLITAILHPTYTALDRSLIISHESMSANHLNAEEQGVSVIFVQLKRKSGALSARYNIEKDSQYPVTAILPALTLAELWQQASAFRLIFKILSGLILVVSLSSIVLNLWSSAIIRKREMAILRTLGASPWSIILLFGIEAFLCVSAAMVLVLACLQISVLSIHHDLAEMSSIFNVGSLAIYLGVAFFSIAVATVAAWQAYRQSINSALTLEY